MAQGTAGGWLWGVGKWKSTFQIYLKYLKGSAYSQLGLRIFGGRVL